MPVSVARVRMRGLSTTEAIPELSVTADESSVTAEGASETAA